MYPHNASYRNTSDAYTSHVLDMLHGCGLNAGQVLAAEERHVEAQQLATMWAATHQGRKQASRSWRQWSGNLLVRAGHRLAGVAPEVGLEIQPATN
jgi:hypothetical protein